MSQPLRQHIGHHIMAAIESKKLIVGLDCDLEQVIWKAEAPEEIRKAVLEFFVTNEKDPD